MSTEMQRRYAFGGLLRLFRKNVGLTQMALAEQMGTSQRGISDWERGLYLPENREKVLKLATHLYLHSDETEQLLIAARLQQPTEGAPPTGDAKSVWSVPHQRNPFFTGREDLLELLWERLHATTAETANIEPFTSFWKPRDRSSALGRFWLEAQSFGVPL